MKKELNPVAVSETSQLKVISDEVSLHDTGSYFHIKKELARVIPLHTVTTPFQSLPLNSPFNLAVKRATDILVSLLVIITILSWLIPLIAVLIKLNSRGPVFFLQRRNKRKGELFTCIKFCSMYKNADADILPASKNDKRITPIGRFLRKYHLDEVPQFFNVLWGDMSLVGPRPHMLSDNVKFDALIKNYSYRHKVKPGITGLAQVIGYKGPAEDIDKMKQRVNTDIFYIRHWSSRLDMLILYRTICKMLGL